MTYDLKNKTIAILATNGFESSELASPRDALRAAGADTAVVSLESGKITGWDHEKNNWGKQIDVDLTIDNASPDDFNALLLPGGVMNPDTLRTDERVQKFVRKFFADGKPVAAICHGPWILINAGVVEGRKMTSYHSIRQDLVNAGAKWVDSPVVVDQGLVTSRHPGDLPQFNDKLCEEVEEGKHVGQTV